ncbi:MAG: hypothetical protein JST61_04440 [Acidobacteria bacterium]|nr:hypothetical protein [Acidobacteriota bacterium]
MAAPLSTRLALATIMIAAAMESPEARSQSPLVSPCAATEPGNKVPMRGSTEQSTQKADRAAAPCSQEPAKDPSAAQKFPFPGEAPAPPMPGSSSSAPDVPASPAQHPSAAEEHPFPGSAPPMPSDSSSSSSSSSDNSPENGAPPFDDKGDNPGASTRRRLPKVQKLQSDEDRAAEDLNVARFYEQSGDLNAAYLRAKDAVKYLPSDPDTHFTLAHLAQKLDKRDEAIAEYNAYLKLAPDGLQIKQAKRALDLLQR